MLCSPRPSTHVPFFTLSRSLCARLKLIRCCFTHTAGTMLSFMYTSSMREQVLPSLCYVGLLPLIRSNPLKAATPLLGKAPVICSQSIFAIPYRTLLEHLQEHYTPYHFQDTVQYLMCWLNAAQKLGSSIFIMALKVETASEKSASSCSSMRTT